MVYKNIKRRSFFDKNKVFTFLLAILLLIITFYLAISNIKLNEKRSELDKRAEELRREVEALEERNSQLQGGLSNSLQLEHKERVLREKGLYKKEGENMVVILSPEKKEEEEKEKEEPKGFFESLWEKINWRD